MNAAIHTAALQDSASLLSQESFSYQIYYLNDNHETD